MDKYKIKNTEKEVVAIQWTGKNIEKIFGFTGTAEIENDFISDDLIIRIYPKNDIMLKRNDWLIKTNKGNITSCGSDIFEKTYKKVQD